MQKRLPYSSALLSAGLLSGATASAATPVYVFEGQNGTTTGLGPTTKYALQYNIGTLGTAGVVVVLCWGNIESNGPSITVHNGSITIYNGGSPSATNSVLADLAGILKSTNTSGGHPSSADQGLIIGVKGGACAPAWLNTLTTLTHPVPMPTFETRPFNSEYGTITQGCGSAMLPASWDATYESEYQSVVGSLMSILGTTTLTADPAHTLLDHVVAVVDGAMVQTYSDELGVFSTGCTANGTTATSPHGSVGMTSYQVAETWASLPPPDNYTPAKAQAAYRTMFDGLLNEAASLRYNKWGAQIGVTQGTDASDSKDWPLIDANGIPLPPQDPPVAAVPMYVPILAQAATDAMDCFSQHGTLSNGVVLSHCGTVTQLSQAAAAATAVVGWPGLFNDSTSNTLYGYSGTAVPGVVLIVNAGAQSGAGVKWQFNNDSHQASIAQTYIAGNFGTTGLPNSTTIAATSCAGRESTPPGSDPPLGDPSCFGTIQTLAAESSMGAISTATILSLGGTGINPPSAYSGSTLNLQWLEVHPIDALPLINSSNSSTIGPMYGCFNDGVVVGAGTLQIGPACPP